MKGTMHPISISDLNCYVSHNVEMTHAEDNRPLNTNERSDSTDIEPFCSHESTGKKLHSFYGNKKIRLNCPPIDEDINNTLDNLPDEIKQEILSYLPAIDLRNSNQLSKSFYELNKEDLWSAFLVQDYFTAKWSESESHAKPRECQYFLGHAIRTYMDTLKKRGLFPYMQQRNDSIIVSKIEKKFSSLINHFPLAGLIVKLGLSYLKNEDFLHSFKEERKLLSQQACENKYGGETYIQALVSMFDFYNEPSFANYRLSVLNPNQACDSKIANIYYLLKKAVHLDLTDAGLTMHAIDYNLMDNQGRIFTASCLQIETAFIAALKKDYRPFQQLLTSILGGAKPEEHVEYLTRWWATHFSIYHFSSDWLLSFADISYNIKQKEVAEFFFNEAIVQFDLEEEACFDNLLRAFIIGNRIQQYESVIAIFGRLNEKFECTLSIKCMCTLALAYQKVGQLETSLMYFEKILQEEQCNSYKGCLLEAAQACTEMGYAHQALEFYVKFLDGQCIEESKVTPVFISAFALAHWKTGNKEEALKLLDKAFENETKLLMADVKKDRGIPTADVAQALKIYEEMGRVEQVIMCCERLFGQV